MIFNRQWESQNGKYEKSPVVFRGEMAAARSVGWHAICFKYPQNVCFVLHSNQAFNPHPMRPARHSANASAPGRTFLDSCGPALRVEKSWLIAFGRNA